MTEPKGLLINHNGLGLAGITDAKLLAEGNGIFRLELRLLPYLEDTAANAASTGSHSSEGQFWKHY